MFMVEVEMDQAQLIRSIEQQLENLMSLDEDLEYEYECELYYDCNDDEEPEPIIEKFTPELLTELENLVYGLDND
jgi:ABC-type dipeptide/oligopeptide/nickel transport system ATPase component